MDDAPAVQDMTGLAAASPAAVIGKMRPPRQRITSTVRARLLAQLDASLGAVLTIAQSPAGFGKTVLFGQWFDLLRARGDTVVGWLSLDDDDREVTQFLAHVAGCLEQAGLPLGPEVTSPAQSFSEVGQRRDRLCEVIERTSAATVLILDDYHRGASPDVDAVIEQLVRKVSSGFQIVLSTRDPPAIRVADLEAQGLVSRIGAADLSLDLADTAAIFGGRLEPPTLLELHARTEGWAVALQLAKLWLDRDPARQREIAAFSGRTDAIARYLLEQVVRDLDPPLRDFLIETSVLETFDADVADSIRERSDSRQSLARLASFDALIIPLDAQRRWFRYHQLFAEFLREDLLLRNAPRLRELHRRASARYAAEGNIQRAVKHACSAGATAQAVAIIQAAGGWELVLHRGIGFARGLLSLFDDAAIEGDPVLLRMQGYLHMKFGALEEARRCIARAATLTSDAAGERDGTIVDALLRTYSDEAYDDEWIGQLEARARTLPDHDVLGRGTLRAALAVSALGRGAFDRAAAEAAAGIAAMSEAGSVLGEAYCRYHLAQSQVYRGDLDAAETGLRAVLVAVEEDYGGDRALKAIGNGLLGHVLSWRGEAEEARQRLRDALPAIEAHDSWLDILSASYGAAIRLFCEAGEYAAALDLLTRIDHLAKARSLPQLTALAGAWRTEALLAIGNMEAAAAAAAAITIVPPRGWRVETAQGIVQAQLHLRFGRSAEALRVLRPLQAQCSRQGRRLDLARTDLLLAAAFRARGEMREMADHALAALTFANAVSAPRIVTSLSIDLDALLGAVVRRLGEAAMPMALRMFVRQVRGGLVGRSQPCNPLLSAREVAVLTELCVGRSNKEIGRRLDLTENTVKFHLKRIYEKLDAHTRSAAVTAALQRGLVSVD